jgi:hypothetical protein
LKPKSKPKQIQNQNQKQKQTTTSKGTNRQAARPDLEVKFLQH